MAKTRRSVVGRSSSIQTMGRMHGRMDTLTLQGHSSTTSVLGSESGQGLQDLHAQRVQLLKDNWKSSTPISLKRDIFAFTPSVVSQILELERMRELHAASNSPRETEIISSAVWPCSIRSDCTLMLADVSGFCALSEELCAEGASGLDKLQSGINQCFSSLLDIISAYGGDVLNFAGDALIIAWFDILNCDNAIESAQRSKKPDQPQEGVSSLCSDVVSRHCNGVVSSFVSERLMMRRRLNAIAAVRCGLELAATQPCFHDRKLQLHVSVASGPLNLYVAGGESSEYQFMTMGSLYKSLGHALAKAKAQELVFDSKTKDLIGNVCTVSLADTEDASSSDRQVYYRGIAFQDEVFNEFMVDVKRGYKEMSSSKDQESNFSELRNGESVSCDVNLSSKPTTPSLEMLAYKMLMFVPPPLVIDPYVQQPSLSVEAEIRDVTVIFIKLDGPRIHCALNNDDGLFLSLIDDIVGIAQRALAAYEAMLRQFLVDDKGMVMIFALGVPKCVHFDDATRGLQCATKFCQDLSRIDVHAYAGVTSGTAYSGTVGNRSRKEFALVGNTVNMAARLMSFGCKSAMEWAAAQAQIAEDKKRLAMEKVRAGTSSIGVSSSKLSSLPTVSPESSIKLENSFKDGASAPGDGSTRSSTRLTSAFLEVQRDTSIFANNWCIICDEDTRSRCDMTLFNFTAFHDVKVKGMAARKSLYGVTSEQQTDFTLQWKASNCVGFDHEFAEVKRLLRTKDMRRRLNYFESREHARTSSASDPKQNPNGLTDSNENTTDKEPQTGTHESKQSDIFENNSNKRIQRRGTVGGDRLQFEGKFDHLIDFRAEIAAHAKRNKTKKKSTSGKYILESGDDDHENEEKKSHSDVESDGDGNMNPSDKMSFHKNNSQESSYASESESEIENKQTSESKLDSDTIESIKEKHSFQAHRGLSVAQRKRQQSCIVDYKQSAQLASTHAYANQEPRIDSTSTLPGLRRHSRLTTRVEFLEDKGGTFLLIRSDEGAGKSTFLQHSCAFAASVDYVPLTVSLRPEDHYQPYSALSKVFALLVLNKQALNARMGQAETIDLIDQLFAEWEQSLTSGESSKVELIKEVILTKTEWKHVGWDANESKRSYQKTRSALIKLLLTPTGRTLLNKHIVLAFDDVHFMDTCSWDVFMSILVIVDVDMLLMGTSSKARSKSDRGVSVAPATTPKGNSKTDVLPHQPKKFDMTTGTVKIQKLDQSLSNSSRKGGFIVTIELPRLSLGDIEILIQQTFPERNWISSEYNHIYDVSQGHPFFAIEIARGLSLEPLVYESDIYSPGSDVGGAEPHDQTHHQPDALAKAFHTRLDGLSMAEQRCLKAASVIGTTFDYDTLAEILPRSFLRRREDDLTLLDAVLELLVLENFIRIKPALGTYEFSHPKLQQTCYKLLLRADQIMLHKQVATWLSRVHQDDLRGHYVPLLYHFLRADEFDKAMDFATASIENYVETGAFHEAHVLLNEILNHVQRGNIKLRTLRIISSTFKQIIKTQIDFEEDNSGSRDLSPTRSNGRAGFWTSKQRFLFGDDLSDSSAYGIEGLEESLDDSSPEHQDFLSRVMVNKRPKRNILGRFMNSSGHQLSPVQSTPCGVFFVALEEADRIIEQHIRDSKQTSFKSVLSSSSKRNILSMKSKSNILQLSGSKKSVDPAPSAANGSTSTKICTIQ